MRSISSNVQNDLEGSLIIYKGVRFASGGGIFVNFHQKLVVYYIGLLWDILDINYVLIEFILWDQRLLKGFILRNILRD